MKNLPTWVGWNMQNWNWVTVTCEHLCLEVTGKLSVLVIRAFSDETNAFLCGIGLGSLCGWWLECWVCFQKEQFKLSRTSCRSFSQKKKSVSILRAAANEQQWERGYFWNHLRHLVINSTFPCQVQDCKKGFDLHDKNDYYQRLPGLFTDMLPSA